MNTVPLFFAEDVARFVHYKSRCSLKESRSGVFGDVGRSLWKMQIYIDVNVVLNPEAGTFDYCLSCKRRVNGVFGSEEAYTYDPAHGRTVSELGVYLLEDKSYVNCNVQWTTATRTDPTFLKWLSAPFARIGLNLQVNCPEFLNVLPDYCTFNAIYAYSAYNEALDEIIQRSQDCGRLEEVNCYEFFQKRRREAAADWILTNRRLKYISPYNIEKTIDEAVALFGAR